MFEPASIMLCFISSEKSELDLAVEYWNRDSGGQWQTTVQAIADKRGVRKHKIPEQVQRAALAYDMSVRCSDCSTPRQLTSRSDALQSTWQVPHYICDDCRSARAERARQEEEYKKKAERERLGKIVQMLSREDQEFNYAEIGYLDAVLAYGIMLRSESAVASGSVGNPYQLALCPSNSLLSKLLGRLHDHGILLFGPDTPVEAIDPASEEGKGISYFPLKVNWQFAGPTSGEAFPRVFRGVGSVVDARVDDPEYFDATSELWWMLGTDDAIRYLDKELNSYQFSGFVAGEKMKEALSYGLNRFSIPRLRYLLYRIAKNTAALSSRRGFNRRHALNTIPGSLIRDCDRAIADNWSIKPYCMKWDKEEARLITLLFDRVLGTGIEGFKSVTGGTFERTAA